MERLSQHTVLVDPVPDLEVEWEGGWRTMGEARVRDGHFPSPAATDLPAESRTARFRMLLPRSEPRAVCLHFAATGDVGYTRRQQLARPLLAEGVGAVLLENAYYGARRPAGQFRVALRRVDDLLRMGRATLEEGRALVGWLHGQGYPVCVTGYSMGGHMAAAVAATAPHPVCAAISGAGITVSGIFTRGLLARQIAWSRLGEDASERLAEALSVIDRKSVV